MKFRPAWTLGVVVILACASLVAVRYIDRVPSQRLASLLGITLTVGDVTATPSPSPRALPVGTDQSVLLGSVAVQTFFGATLIRQGPGTVVSADGLILTTVAAAPYGSGAYVYQVTTSQGQLMRARRVASDHVTGLALLKAEATDLDVVFFEASTPLAPGQQLDAIAAQMQISTFSSQRLPLWVVEVRQDSRVTLSLDRTFGYVFHGARVIDQLNHSVGMLKYASVPTFLSATTINSFLEAYLARQITP